MKSPESQRNEFKSACSKWKENPKIFIIDGFEKWDESRKDGMNPE